MEYRHTYNIEHGVLRSTGCGKTTELTGLQVCPDCWPGKLSIEEERVNTAMNLHMVKLIEWIQSQPLSNLVGDPLDVLTQYGAAAGILTCAAEGTIQP